MRDLCFRIRYNAWMKNLKPIHVILLCVLAWMLVACHTSPQQQASNGNDAAPKTALNPAEIKDATPQHEAYSKYGNPASYKVFGKSYKVWDSHIGYEEQGLASWYGTKFHGKRTSSGEPYDMYQMTAAHKNLPIPSYARVTNLDTGKAIVVRVNDRGPFHSSRIIDLSYAAATKLDILKTGTGRVKVESLDTSSARTTKVAANTPMSAGKSNNSVNPIYVQVAAFTELEKANSLAAQLKPHSPHPVEVSKNSNHYRVHVGPFNSHHEVSNFKEVLANLGINNPFVMTR